MAYIYTRYAIPWDSSKSQEISFGRKIHSPHAISWIFPENRSFSLARNANRRSRKSRKCNLDNEFLRFRAISGRPRGTGNHNFAHSNACKSVAFCDFWNFEDPQRIANGVDIHSPNAISWNFLGPRGVRAREERSPAFPEIAEMQFEQGKHKGSCDSRASRWDGKSQNDTLFWPQK